MASTSFEPHDPAAKESLMSRPSTTTLLFALTLIMALPVGPASAAGPVVVNKVKLSAQTGIQASGRQRRCRVNQAAQDPQRWGQGTKADPFLICTEDQLVNMSALSSAALDAYYALGRDLDLTDVAGITPIGPCTAIGNGGFRGDFDGRGHSITGLTIDQSDDPSAYNVGLFGCAGRPATSGAIETRIHDLVLDAPTVLASPVALHMTHPGGSRVGALVGLADNVYGLSDVQVIDGVVSGRTKVGGLVGSVDNTLVERASFEGFVETDSGEAGGLIGSQNFSSVVDCYARAEVTGSVTGGLVGYASTDSGLNELCRSYAASSVSGFNVAGGIIGRMHVNTTGLGHITTGALFCGQPDPTAPTAGTVFWDVDIASDATHSVGQFTGWNSQPVNPGGTQGVSTSEMLDSATFVQAGWNLANTAWKLASRGYPDLN